MNYNCPHSVFPGGYFSQNGPWNNLYSFPGSEYNYNILLLDHSLSQSSLYCSSKKLLKIT